MSYRRYIQQNNRYKQSQKYQQSQRYIEQQRYKQNKQSQRYKQNSIISSQQQSSVEQMNEQKCRMCRIKQQKLIEWIRSNLYIKENNYYGRYIKIINTILKGNSIYNLGKNHQYFINYKQAMIQSNTNQIQNMEYKKFNIIISEIKLSITQNISNYQHYDKFYFGNNNFQTMIKYQNKKRQLLKRKNNYLQANKSTQSNKYTQYNKNTQLNDKQYKPKFIINKSGLSTNQSQKILQNSTLNQKYQFYPVQMFQKYNINQLKNLNNSNNISNSYNKNSISKFQNSHQQIQKIKKNLSIMINQFKLHQDVYPQIKNIHKPYIDFVKTKSQLKFRKLLQNNISQISQNQTNKLKKSYTNRLYTSPDVNNQQDYKYAQAYGLLLQQNLQQKRNKKRSLLRKQTQLKRQTLLKKQLSKQKSYNNLSKNINTTKSTNNLTNTYTSTKTINLSRTKIITSPSNKISLSRQVTQQGSHLIISGTNSSSNMNLRKSKSKSKLKGSSKNKLLLATSTSRNKLKSSTNMDKSINKSRKLLMQYKG